jgi:hypothetical protein
MAKRSAAISKSPNALTAVMLGKEGTLKCSPGGKALKKIVARFTTELELEIIIELPACIFLIDIQVLVDEKRFVAYFDPEEESFERKRYASMS